MSRFLAGRTLKKIGSTIIEDLIRKTDGLPLAASLFATLVLDFGRHPSDLLSGNMVNTVRLRKWFDEVLSLTGENESRLLHILSVCDGPFNEGVVRKLCRHERIPSTEQTFEDLQRTYLIQKYSPFRWNVHRLIAMFCLSEMKEEEKRAINLVLAHHYLAGFIFREGRVLNEEEFFWKIKACKQFQQAKAFKESERILHEISKTINYRGHYELFIQLGAIELIENRKRDNWIDYHYAHFCLITGKLRQSLRVIEPILYSSSEYDVNKRLSFMRLYAEIIGAMDKPGLALQEIRQAMNAVDLTLVSPTVLSQARTTEVWLLTKLEKYSEAKHFCEALIAESAQSGNKLGAAIALTHSGIIYHSSGAFALASEQLANAVSLFRECEIRRGLAWSLSHLAIAQLALGNRKEAVASINGFLKIYYDTGECSIDYLDCLRILKQYLSNQKIAHKINSEIRRVSTALSDSMPDAIKV